MSVIIGEDTEIGKELKKWDTPRRQGGMRCDGYEPFPKMLYKAFTRENGKVMCGDPHDEDFTRTCQRTVRDGDELARAEREGWAGDPLAAIAAHERDQIAIADAAARRLYSDQRMSPQARAEAAAADDATHVHVADVPAPRKKPGPKPRVAQTGA